VTDLATTQPSRRETRVTLRRAHLSDSRWFTLLVAVVYVAVSLLANYGAWVHGVTHTVQTAGGGDTYEAIWYLAQTPWAIIHGHNPLATNILNAPTGVNLMDNASMPLIGVVGTPITLLFGPIATFNIMLNLALAGSSMTFYLMARRFIAWRPAAFVGGLLYGFSPFVAAEGVGHLLFVVGVIPPLLILLLDRFFRTQSDPPWLTGLLVGGCFVAQLYISAEFFASMVVITAIAAALWCVYWLFRRPRVDVSRVARMGACAVGVLALVGGFGIWTALAGPDHIDGPAQSATTIAGLSSDPVGLVVPSRVQRFTFGHAELGNSLVAQRDANWHIIVDAPIENGSYVGFPLLIILIVGTIALRRKRLVQFAAALAVAGMLLSMGSYLHIDGHRTGIPLPFDVLAHLPLFESGAASRYAQFFWLFAALLLALFVNALYVRLDGWDRPGDRLRATFASGLVVFCALILLVPAWPYGSSPSNVPSWFTTTARSLPVGSTVVVFPFASPTDASAMLWQAMAHDTFRMPGGYAVFRSADGTATFASDASLVQQVLSECSSGDQLHLSPSTIRSELRSWNASLAAVVVAAPGSACATRLFDSAYGPHTTMGGVRLWTTK
jgi:hypothetical protein